ncbi:hypothetical protein J4Q44_G00233090 [Coregonus suidteri]|uniref:Uncharacterized protein n=1 Tax=Coregonus suidteri TaxID=861788 RepID=A0AAN8L749_9TELE
MNFMNVIFAAQKQNILIYACVLDSDSGLQQSFPCSGYSCQTLTNAPNWCCHLLSMWITKHPICTTCETAFKVPLPQMVKSKKKKLKPST